MKGFYEYGNPRFDGKHMDDCYIRAVVLATKMPFEEVEELFQRKQIELQSDLPNRPWVIESVMSDMGYTYTETINPATGMGSMKVYSFLKIIKVNIF